MSNPTSQDIGAMFVSLLAPTSLQAVFNDKIAPSDLRGIDRVDSERFRKVIAGQVDIIHEKCLNGKYRFTPYLEILKSRGRNKCPRVLAIATVRDRLVLSVLKELLHYAFPRAVPKLPNQYVRDIKALVLDDDSRCVVKADVKSFYDTVRHRQLLDTIGARLPVAITRLLERAIRNPTVTRGSHMASDGRLRELSIGIPQGLSISNILAEIYLQGVDETVSSSVPHYFRYVDDILMFTPLNDTDAASSSLEQSLASVGLSLAAEKEFTGVANESFDYLGYRLQLPTVSVKQGNVRRFVGSLASLFVRFTNRGDVRYRNTWLDKDALETVFLHDLNEHITGSIDENRRYGWLFYFSEVNDVQLLYSIDRIVVRFWQRFLSSPLPDIKRFVRAYHEIRFNQTGSYIHNYNRYDTPKKMLAFLVRRGHLDSQSPTTYTTQQIQTMFRRAKFRNLSRLDADVGAVS